ncbi:MAG: PQQ-binding-like beta-propeller repeat protein [Chthoniobacteraceae bacterium]
MKTVPAFLAMLTGGVGAAASADDWPQFRGPDRDAVWKETGIAQTFPADGLKVAWRAPVGNGLSSPVVAKSRVFLIGSELAKPKARERVHCLDGKTGRPLWTHAYDVTYPDWAFDPKQNGGPNATPIVQEGKVYTLGQMGDLLCLDAAKGTVLWQRNLMKEYATKEFTGTTPSPLIEGGMLILVPGVQPGACVIAFDKDSGREIWRALDDPFTYSSPIVITAGGQRQLIVWTPKSVVSLDPATGRTWWREEVDTTNAYGSAPAVLDGDRLLVSGLMFQLAPAKPAASVLWPERKIASKVVLSACSIPVMKDDHVYSGKTSGQLVCLDAGTGKEIWITDKVTSKGSGATIHITPNGGSFLLFTDQGNLIRARLSPKGYEELSRVHLVDPTLFYAGRKLVWPPPAYANGHIFVHNGGELVCASLEAEPRAR